MPERAWKRDTVETDGCAGSLACRKEAAGAFSNNRVKAPGTAKRRRARYRVRLDCSSIQEWVERRGTQMPFGVIRRTEFVVAARSDRPMRLEKRTNLAHRQRDSLLGFFPREHAHFSIGREHRAL